MKTVSRDDKAAMARELAKAAALRNARQDARAQQHGSKLIAMLVKLGLARKP